MHGPPRRSPDRDRLPQAASRPALLGFLLGFILDLKSCEKRQARIGHVVQFGTESKPGGTYRSPALIFASAPAPGHSSASRSRFNGVALVLSAACRSAASDSA